MKKGDLIIWLCSAVVFICALSERTVFMRVCCGLTAVVLIIDIIRILRGKRNDRNTEA